jgi:hypothetical protein
LNKTVSFLIFSILLHPLFISAGTIRVPQDQPTIQAGIDAAVNGDVVLVADGTYTGSGNRDIDFNGKAITVKSENGADTCVIDCEHVGRGFFLHSGEGRDSIIQGFHIHDGRMTRGSGIYCENGSSPTIERNKISGCTADYAGAGIYCHSASPLIINNVIDDNRVLYSYGLFDGGGGICCDLSTPVITGNTITGNRVLCEESCYGGGILCIDSSPVITDNTITFNEIHHTVDYNCYGGGICCLYSSPSIQNNIVSNNEVFSSLGSGYGGGICCEYSTTAAISGNAILDNSVRAERSACGGGIYTGWSSSPLIFSNKISRNYVYTDGYDFHASQGGGIYSRVSSTIINNIITANIAEYNYAANDAYGGGIYHGQGDVKILNNILAENYAESLGGGLYITGCRMDVINTIMWENDSGEGLESVVIKMGSNPSILTISYSDLEGGASAVNVASGCTLNWGAGMIDADPLFVNGPLGGYYLSQTAAGQSEDSPCVDAGDAVIQWPCLPFTVCGTTRTDIAPDTGIMDMGYHYAPVGIKTPPGRLLEDVP